MKRKYLYLAVDTYDRLWLVRPRFTLGPSFGRNAVRCSLLLTLIFLSCSHAYFQSPQGLAPPKGLGENALLLKVQKRFKLSPEEVKNIRPRISEESQKVLRIFTRFVGDGYSPRLWYEVADGRLEFEKTLTEKLTKRQRAALRAARTDMEAQILNYLVEDYVGSLSAFLELDEWGFDGVEKLFESEKTRKHRVVVEHLSDPPFLRAEIERISRETERELRSLLSVEQWRGYEELAKVPNLIAANPPTRHTWSPTASARLFLN